MRTDEAIKVMDAVDAAVAAERERCAKIAERWPGDVDEDGSIIPAREGIASAIRKLTK